jgi:hypothetical protein
LDDYHSDEEDEQWTGKRFSAHTVTWVDTRVQGDEWQQAFLNVSADYEEVPLGAPPGLNIVHMDTEDSRISDASSVDLAEAMEKDLEEMNHQISSATSQFFQKSTTVWSSFAEGLVRHSASSERPSCTVPIGLIEY